MKINNFMSFQPQKPQRDILKNTYNIDCEFAERENAPGVVNSGTPGPKYKDVRQCIEMQIEVAYRTFYDNLMVLIKDPKTTSEQYAAAADARNYGTRYSRTPTEPGKEPLLNYPDEYERTTKFVLAFLQSLPPSMSVDTRTWAERLRLDLLFKTPPYTPSLRRPPP